MGCCVGSVQGGGVDSGESVGCDVGGPFAVVDDPMVVWAEEEAVFGGGSAGLAVGVAVVGVAPGGWAVASGGRRIRLSGE